MVVASAKAKSLRISSMKLRKIARLIRGVQVDCAISMLRSMPHKAAVMLYKVLVSAKSNYLYGNLSGSTESLQVSTVFVNEGKSFARIKPRARGKADKIYRPTAHLTLFLSDQE